MNEIAVESRCQICCSGDTKVGIRHGSIVHKLPPTVFEDRYLGLAQLKIEGQRFLFDEDGYRLCPDWDEEFRHIGEPLGWYTFAWWPVRCRNGKMRWLKSVERHVDGTYTLGDRAH